MWSVAGASWVTKRTGSPQRSRLAARHIGPPIQAGDKSAVPHSNRGNPTSPLGVSVRRFETPCYEGDIAKNGAPLQAWSRRFLQSIVAVEIIALVPLASRWPWRNRKGRRHARLGRRMLETATRFSLLAFGTPGFAPDEHLSGTQQNHWSRHEPNQAE